MNQQESGADHKYKALYDIFPDMICSLDGKGVLIDVNDRIQEYFGYEKKEVIGRPCFDFISDSHKKIAIDAFTEMMEKGTGPLVELLLVKKDKSTFFGICRGTKIIGKPEFIITIQDVSQLHDLLQKVEASNERLTIKYEEINKINEKLSIAESRYHSLYDTSPLLYRTIDINGLIINCNKTYADTLGYVKEEILGKSIFDHVAQKSNKELKASFDEWKSTGKTAERLIWLKRKNGTDFPTVFIATSIYDTNQKIIGSNTVIRDVSDIHSAKQEIEEHKIKKLTALGELSARIAHDMRNPMSTIKNATNIIKINNPNLDKNTLHKFSVIDSAIARMTHQIDEVLEFVVPRPPLLIHTTTTKILQNVFDRISVPNTVKIILHSKDVNINCDPYKMEIVLVNLITNAIQAMGNKGTITITTVEKDDDLILDINDTGMGIPQELISKIFDPLFTTRQIGTGLGLTSCKSIIEQHGGSISVKTEIGKGSVFTLKIPKRGQLVL